MHNRATDVPAQETPISQSFWKSPSIQELARSQNVQPMANVRTLFGTWSDEENDGFEAAIDELRRRDVKTGTRP